MELPSKLIFLRMYWSLQMNIGAGRWKAILTHRSFIYSLTRLTISVRYPFLIGSKMSSVLPLLGWWTSVNSVNGRRSIRVVTVLQRKWIPKASWRAAISTIYWDVLCAVRRLRNCAISKQLSQQMVCSIRAMLPVRFGAS